MAELPLAFRPGTAVSYQSSGEPSPPAPKLPTSTRTSFPHLHRNPRPHPDAPQEGHEGGIAADRAAGVQASCCWPLLSRSSANRIWLTGSSKRSAARCSSTTPHLARTTRPGGSPRRSDSATWHCHSLVVLCYAANAASLDHGARVAVAAAVPAVGSLGCNVD